MAKEKLQIKVVSDASAEVGLPQEMSQDIGLKGGEAAMRRQDAEDLDGPMSLKDWVWINKQRED